MAQPNIREVTLAVARVIDGEQHKADDTVSVTDLEARNLVRAGLARWPSDGSTESADTVDGTPVEQDPASEISAPLADEITDVVATPVDESVPARASRVRTPRPTATAPATPTETEA